MTEMKAVYQLDMFGGEVIAGDVVERCRHMLATDPHTRDDYDYAAMRYLELYHGLPRECRAAVMQVLGSGAPSIRTIFNRCQELMKADADLRPPDKVMEHRQRQRYQGRVR